MVQRAVRNEVLQVEGGSELLVVVLGRELVVEVIFVDVRVIHHQCAKVAEDEAEQVYSKELAAEE